MRAPLRILPLLALLAVAAGSAHAAAVTNLWVRKTGGDPKASTAANWSLGHAPRADEVAVFSPRHPTAAIWDAAAPKEIGGLVLSRGYVAVVTVETSRGGPLQSLRVHGDVARIETDSEGFELATARRFEIAFALRKEGFPYVTLDLEGFRSGSMDEPLLNKQA